MKFNEQSPHDKHIREALRIRFRSVKESIDDIQMSHILKLPADEADAMVTMLLSWNSSLD